METKQLNEKKTTITPVAECELFTIIKVESNEKTTHKIAAGDAIISDKDFDTITDAKKYINKKPYELLTNLMCLTYQKMKSYEESQPKH